MTSASQVQTMTMKIEAFWSRLQSFVSTRERRFGLTVVLTLIGLLLRAYFAFFKDIFIDEAIFYGYAAEPGLFTVLWPNYPPLFASLMKLIALPVGPSVMLYELLVFLLSSASLLLLVRFLYKKNVAMWALFFCCLNVTSIVNSSQIRPAALAEFFGVLIFLSVVGDFQKKWILWLSGLGLMLTTYVAPVLGLFLLTLNRTRKLFGALAVLAFIFLVNLSLIRWSSLAWMQTRSPQQGFFAGFQVIRDFYGYWWFGLVTFLALLFFAKNSTLWKRVAAITVLVMAVNLGLNLQANETRHFMFFNPWIIWVYALVFETAPKKLAVQMLAFIFSVCAIANLVWFIKTPYSGLKDLMAFVEQHPEKQIVFLDKSPVLKNIFHPNTYLTELNQVKNCPETIVAIEAFNPVRTQKDIQQSIEAINCSLVSQKTLGGDAIEPIVVYELRNRN